MSRQILSKSFAVCFKQWNIKEAKKYSHTLAFTLDFSGVFHNLKVYIIYFSLKNALFYILSISRRYTVRAGAGGLNGPVKSKLA